ncbi:unnamed protein product [Oikopleura dioica]|uniref:BTB domain-containing protein n=1 Tax=Oikopleura dioica TaxID=34765 RepID=E4XX48_OIKDI|nr:unnamed protein product [Oikopleura dioica]
MCDPSTHGISQELRNEYLNQQFASEFDQNGCDLTILAADGETIYSHGMILSCQSPVFRRTVKIESTVKCRWHSQVVKSLLLFMYGMPSELDNPNSTVELLLCATYYQIEWLCEKLTFMLKSNLSSNKTPVHDTTKLALSYRLCLLLQDMDVENRAPFDALVGPLFHFCCEQIKTAASCSNFPEKINITECINTIMVIYLLLSFFPALCPINNEKMGDIEMEIIPQEGIRQMLRFQIFGRIHSVQEMMLNAVKNAQREFPSVIYFREDASKLIKVGDKVIQEDNTPEKYFHSRHAGIGQVSDFCGPKSAGIGCGGCKKHVYVDWGDQKCWCRMGYENLYELKLLR